MGLTSRSVGLHAVEKETSPPKPLDARVIALAGNPNVGKSTVFNALTGMHQHTGNWPGKTVTGARGTCRGRTNHYLLVDLPGTYSLLAHSPEEEIARNFICFEEPDAVIVVCDATCLERNLNLVLQIIECSPSVIVCVNLLDEAKRKGISVDLSRLESLLGVPVVGTVAQKKKSLSALLSAVDQTVGSVLSEPPSRVPVPYPAPLESAISVLTGVLENRNLGVLSARWLSLRLLERDATLQEQIDAYLGHSLIYDLELLHALSAAEDILLEHGISRDVLQDVIASSAILQAEEIAKAVTAQQESGYSRRDRKLDRFLTGKYTAYPTMILLLALCLWITVSLANIPSSYLSGGLFYLLGRFSEWMRAIGAPPWLNGLLSDGMLRVLAWVISVMLPPMAIFFPLFTLLEDMGYLPRVAYNLDRPFRRCHACGKQALTMCMGFGCNAAGVVGCRIIDSPRERMLAILTNSLVPCNGKFPALIALLSMLLIPLSASATESALAVALLLVLLMLLGILLTFLSTRLLSATLLRGMPSSFTLELPPFRRPQVGRVLVRSLLDRTLFVLGRSVAVAAPAGLVIWILANVTVGDLSLLSHASALLDPFGRVLGMDGVILLSFLLGLPANEIVIPIMLMIYQSAGSLAELGGIQETWTLLAANGWTWRTTVCVLLFFLLHWPCSTTLLTVKKETGSLRWALVAAALPTLLGMLLCALFTAVTNCIL